MKKIALVVLAVAASLALAPIVVNAQNFWQQTNGLDGVFVWSLAISPSGYVFVGSDSGFFRSTDNGDSWTKSNYGWIVSSLVINASEHVFAGTTNGGGIFRSTDNGDSWTAVDSSLTNLNVRSLAINVSGHVFAGIGWPGGILRSTDNGDNWSTVYSGSTSLYVPSLAINASGHIFAGLHAYLIDGGILRSTDNGDSWTELYTSSTIGFNCLAINASGHVFAGTSGEGIFRSTDNGDSWTSVNTGLTDLWVGSLAINASGHIFAGTGDGVFLSIDNGDSWTAVNTGLINLSVQSLAVAPSGHIFAGTSGDGFFRSVQSTTAVYESASAMPSSFLLEQNYPNPFNPRTTIEFALPKASFVSLKIYDLLGNEVATLVSEKLPAGKHQRVWEAKGLASGVYLYRLQAGDPSAGFPSKSGQAAQGFEETKKLILLR